MSTLKKTSYDFYLILATAIVLAIISGICVYGMFYFKFAQMQQLAPALKSAYMEWMNRLVSPFIIALIVLLGICVPKRLLPTEWLNRFAVTLLFVVAGVSWAQGVVMALKVALCVTLALQTLVLGLALAGSGRLHFERKGYWIRVGSSCLHLGVILFILDLFFYTYHTLHLALFWATTAATVIGMTACFYSPFIATMVGARTGPGEPEPREDGP